ncbi:hypothetical protein BGX28_002347 [Mortierella sp. GBA30]|nr:hypothetical protein BGX28_002347 [Mortierella sp. GBA30]
MANPPGSQANLLPLSLLSTSVFQKAKRNPTSSASQSDSPATSTPATTRANATPIVVPHIPVTRLDHESPSIVKKEVLEQTSVQKSTDRDHSDNCTSESVEADSQALIVRPPLNSSKTMPDLPTRAHERPSMPGRESGSSRLDKLDMDRELDAGRGVHGRSTYSAKGRGEWRQDDYPHWRDRDPRYPHGGHQEWDRRPQPYAHPHDPRGHIQHMDAIDPFVQGQSRYGREYYESMSRRAYVGPMENRYGRSDMMSPRHAAQEGQMPFSDSIPSKRRNESASPEPRKKAATAGVDDRAPRQLMDISPRVSPTARVTQIISPLASPTSETPGKEKERTGRRTNQDNAAAYSNITSSPGKSKSSSRRSGTKISASKTHQGQKKKGPSHDSSSSSSSATDSDSDSDSDSDDSDVEDQPLAGSSDLKLHGVVSDLMLELERTRTQHAKYCEKVKTSSRKIRNISKRIQKLLRDLHDRASVDHSVSTRPQLSRRSTADRAGMSSSSAISAKNPQQQTTTTTAVAAIPAQTQPATSRKRVSLPVSQAPQNRRISIASMDVVETFTNVLADVRKGAFSRKPRSMILHSAVAGPDMEEVMVTSALDGSINFWDLENRRVMSTIHKNAMNQPWAEDLCWVGRNVLAVAAASKEGMPATHQLTLAHVAKGKSQKSALGSSGPSLAWTLQTIEEKPHDISKGGIMCIASISEDASGISLATAALDKQIIHWRFTPQNSEGECVPIQQRLIHNKHTNAIQALCYSNQSNTLFSGGSDCKVVGWDMPRSEVVVEYKNAERGRITAISQNPVDPNLFLLCHASTDNQLALHDNRQRFENAVLRFGFSCADNLSKLVVPSWHPGGAIVSCGTQSDPKINIWDIRWQDVQRGAGQSIDVHEKRVYKAAFHPKRSFMTSMSADSSLAFMYVNCLA